MSPLIEHRRAEKLHVIVVETTEVLSPEQIRKGDSQPLQVHLEKLCRDYKGPSYILLAGSLRGSGPAAAEETVVPPLLGSVGRMKGRPSDHAFGCRDGNSMPSAAVGRFPARNVEEIRQMVQKTLRLEENHPPGPWQNRLLVVLGNPGGMSWLDKSFNDWFIQNAGLDRLNRIHPTWSVQAIFHISSSPFCLPDDRLQDATRRYLEEGQFFTFYLGHSGASGLWSNGLYFMQRADWAQVKIPGGQGVFFTCGCYACQFDRNDGDGYGLAAIRNPDGPAAVIGACEESYAAMGQLALDGLFHRFSAPPSPARLADYWLDAAAGLDHGPIDPLSFQLLDQADGSRGRVPLAVQRREHLEMWMLLGDPALLLPIPPSDISLKVAGPVSPGIRITVKGALPERLAGATVHLTLERPIASRPTELEALPDGPVKTRNKIMIENHRRANAVVLATREVKSNGVNFECQTDLPEDLPWENIILRASAATETESAFGVETMQVKKKGK